MSSVVLVMSSIAQLVRNTLYTSGTDKGRITIGAAPAQQLGTFIPNRASLPLTDLQHDIPRRVASLAIPYATMSGRNS